MNITSNNVRTYIDYISTGLTMSNPDYYYDEDCLSTPLMYNLVDFASTVISGELSHPETYKITPESLLQRWVDNKCGWESDDYLHDCFENYDEVIDHVNNPGVKEWTINHLYCLMRPVEALYGM